MKNKKKRFFNFVKEGNGTNELYIYGDIIGGSDKWEESDVTFTDFTKAVNEIGENETLNMYVNSPGGNIFATYSFIGILGRAKTAKNITIDLYLDGLGASCASWLMMIADNIYIYAQSVMMVHKPISRVCGNANDMMKEIELLNKIEEEGMIPMYLKKATNKLTKEMLKDFLNKGTWFTANQICEYFDVTLLENNRQMTACLPDDYFNSHKVPEEVKDIIKNYKKKDDKEDFKIKEIEDFLENNKIENQKIKEREKEEKAKSIKDFLKKQKKEEIGNKIKELTNC